MREGILLDHAPYAPFLDARTAHPPGLSPLEPAEWVPVDADFAAQMAYREILLAEVAETVLAELPEAAGPVAELYAAVLTHLAARPDFAVTPDHVTRPDGRTLPLDPTAKLATLGRLVADDLCVLTQTPGAPEYRLIAAVLCFPSRWSLAEKLGRPLTAIHDPVPDYDATLARRVNRVFAGLRTGRPMVRVNWLVHPSAELHLPVGVETKLSEAAPATDRLYLRTERQTLTRLAQTGAVVFGIKTSLCPLEALTGAQAASLLHHMSAMDADIITYRAGADLHDKALTRLARLAAG